MSVLGLDLGTSGCRVAAYDKAGRELASATSAYGLIQPGPGLAELSPDEVWEASAACLRTVNERLTNDPATALAIAALGEAVVPIDEAGTPLANAPVSADLRALGETQRLVDAIGPDAIRSITGQPPHPMFSIGKIACWQRDSAVWDAATVFTSMAGYVAVRLGCPPAFDYTLAARTMAFDVRERQWSQPILDQAGVPLDRMPAAVPVGARLGVVPPYVASPLGFTGPVELIAGAHDQACALWGAGAVAPGTAAWSLGTTECLTTTSDGWPAGAIAAGFAAYPADDTDRWLLLGGIPSGGSTMHWLLERFGTTEYVEPAERPARLLFLPHLAGSGTIDNDPLSRGAFVGLTLETTRADLVRALVEASGYELARSLGFLSQVGISVTEPRVVGGASSSPRALFARASSADVTLVHAEGHATARGAAFVAGAATGVYPSLSEAASTLRTSARIEPDSATRSWYAAQRERYDRLHPLLQDISHALSEGNA